MATAQTQAFVFMELDYQTDSAGNPLYGEPRVWAPTTWKCRVDDNSERIFVGAQPITVYVPDNFNPVPHQVAALEAEKAEALDLYQRSVASINERLSKLLAITAD